ncbi:hypothetical protein TWF281_004177 [Arthrobotrys megalospora]
MMATIVTGNRLWPLLLLLFPLTISAFFLETAINNGAYFSRDNALKTGNGKPEAKALYECFAGSETLHAHPVEGVVVRNRPDTQPTLALALYSGTACTRTRGKARPALPQVMMLLDPNRIRGVHVVSLKAYGIAPMCNSWQGVKIQEELKPGGALHGLDPKQLPGSLVHWDQNGFRTVEQNAIKWINAIPYEPLSAKRQTAQYLREVVEGHVNPEIAADPKNVEMKALIKSLNTFLGISGDAVFNAPFPMEFLPHLRLNIDDGYDLSERTWQSGGPRAENMPFIRHTYEKNTQPAPLMWSLGDLIGNDKITLEDIRSLKVPMEQMMLSFNRVVDTKENKRAWYHKFEALMEVHLQVLANAWRTFWAWQKANSEIEAARQGIRGPSQDQNASGNRDTSNNQGMNTGMGQGVSGAQATSENQAEQAVDQLGPIRVEIEEEEVPQGSNNNVDVEGQSIIRDVQAENSPLGLRSGVSEFFGDQSDRSGSEKYLDTDFKFDAGMASMYDIESPENVAQGNRDHLAVNEEAKEADIAQDEEGSDNSATLTVNKKRKDT